MSDKVWVLGDAVVDLLPEGEHSLLKCPGGAPANVAVGIARLAGTSGFIGRVGNDPFGHFMKQVLNNEQVDTTWMHYDDLHRTSTVVVALDEQGERSFTFMVRPSADLFIEPGDLPTFEAGQWLHTCSIALSAEPGRSTTFLAMERIKQAGGKVSFDPNIRTDLWADEEALRTCLARALALADVVKLSVEELEFITGESDIPAGIANFNNRYSPALLLVTQGKDGVMVHFQGNTHHFPARPVVCVDTTGAGDAFVAGLLSGLAEQGMPESLEQLTPILTQAQLCGALATTAKGAMTALPNKQDLVKSL